MLCVWAKEARISWLQHLTYLMGSIVVKRTAGGAPLYSLLQENFRERLQAMEHESLQSSERESTRV